MNDENNSPKDKPSFFDFAKEARSWPPADKYEVEDENFDTNAANFFSQAAEPAVPVDPSPETIQAKFTDDQIIDHLYKAEPSLSESVFDELIKSTLPDQQPEPEAPEIDYEPEPLEAAPPLDPIYADFTEPEQVEEEINFVFEDSPIISDPIETEIYSESIPEKKILDEEEDISQVTSPWKLEEDKDIYQDDKIAEILQPIDPDFAFKSEAYEMPEIIKAEDLSFETADDAKDDDDDNIYLKSIETSTADNLTSKEEDYDFAINKKIDERFDFLESPSTAQELSFEQPVFEQAPLETPIEPGYQVSDNTGFESLYASTDDDYPSQRGIEDKKDAVEQIKPFVMPVTSKTKSSKTNANFDSAADVFFTSPVNSEEALFVSDEFDPTPFKAYYSQNYSEEANLSGLSAEPKDKTAAQLNRNILILALVIIVFVLYFLFTNVFNPKYEPKTRRQSRQTVKPKKSIEQIAQESMPLWDITEQKSYNLNQETQLATAIYQSSGRENPFATPDSILSELRKAAEQAIIAKQEPHTYKRKAYRATLLGVLTSNDNTIALVNVQEADFDVLEGSSKDKIIKLAIKSMDKAKKDTLEMTVGSYVGPWQITKIEAPKDAFSDAKITVKYRGQTKAVRMGKAEELGIFDEDGGLDSLDAVDPIKTLYAD
jgi:hypothetical protein